MKVTKEFRIEVGCFLTIGEGDEEEYPELGKLVSKLEKLAGTAYPIHLTQEESDLLTKHTWDKTIRAWKVR